MATRMGVVVSLVLTAVLLVTSIFVFSRFRPRERYEDVRLRERYEDSNSDSVYAEGIRERVNHAMQDACQVRTATGSTVTLQTPGIHRTVNHGDDSTGRLIYRDRTAGVCHITDPGHPLLSQAGGCAGLSRPGTLSARMVDTVVGGIYTCRLDFDEGVAPQRVREVDEEWTQRVVSSSKVFNELEKTLHQQRVEQESDIGALEATLQEVTDKNNVLQRELDALRSKIDVYNRHMCRA
jgi:hypothetical protein